jgi:restriction endonuclease S subunit
LVGVIPGPQLVSDYFYAWFERFDLRTITDTSTLPQINKKDLEPLQIPLPPLPEQREIAAQLSAVDAKLAAEESRRSALAVLFQSLLHHLMTGKVRLPEFITNQTPK